MNHLLNDSIIILLYKVRLNDMKTRIYLRASTKDQDPERVLNELKAFSLNTLNSNDIMVYKEVHTGTKLERPVLNNLLAESMQGDVLLIESVDRLSRLIQSDFEILKQRINNKGLRLVVHDLPTTHIALNADSITTAIVNVINNMLIDLLATMARLDNEKRIERIKQGLARSGYKPNGKTANKAMHNEIKKHLNQKNLTKEEIAKVVGCGVATVYRVARSL